MVERNKENKSLNTLDKSEETSFIGGSNSIKNAESGNLEKDHPPTWKQNFSHYFSQYCGATSIHGVQYLGERGRFIIEKIFWAIVITVVWVVCILLIVKTYEKWVTSPVIVTFATTETPISSIPFPAVTICPTVKSAPQVFNYSDVLLRKVRKLNVTPHEDQKFEAFSLVCTGVDQWLSENKEKGNLTVNDDELYHLLDAFPSLGSNNISEAFWLGDKIAMNTLSVSFSSDGICNSFNMLDYSEILNEFEEYLTNRSIEGTKPREWSLDSGYPDDNLDTFPRRTFVSGFNGGFQALLYTNHSYLDYLCGDALQGFRVALHHSCEFPNMNKHFLVPLDQVVLVAIKPRMITISEQLKSYKPEDRKCYLIHERPLKFFKSYTQQNCLDECFSNYTLLNCSCVPFYMPKNETTSICGPGNNECVEKCKVNFLSNHDCDCLPSCTSLQYDVEISQSVWNWREWIQAFRQLDDGFIDVDLGKTFHLSMIVVYYKEMQFLTSERHELYGYVDFFSNTGGLLGLFIGFSVTSAIEILYFLTLRLTCNIRKFGKRFWSGEPELVSAEKNQ